MSGERLGEESNFVTNNRQRLTAAADTRPVLTTDNTGTVMSSSSIRNSPVVAAPSLGSRTMSIDRGRARTRNSAATAGGSMTR